MTDIDPEEAGLGVAGPPARPPGPPPAGFVPAERAEVLLPPRWPDSQLTTGGGPGTGLMSDPLGSPPRTKSAAWRWLLYAAIGFLVGQVVGAIFGIVAGDIAGKTAAQMKAITTAAVPPEWYVLSTLAGLWFGFFGAPWLASRRQGTRSLVADLGLRFRWIDLWAGIGIGVAGQIVIALLYEPFRHHIHNFDAPSQKLTGGAHGVGFLVVALATVLLAPFMEELFFRGLLFKALTRLFTPNRPTTRARTVAVVAAVVVDGLLFGLAHGEWVQFAGLALFGVVLAAVSFRTGRLGMNMVSHASFNLVAVLAILGQRGGVIH